MLKRICVLLLTLAICFGLAWYSYSEVQQARYDATTTTEAITEAEPSFVIKGLPSGDLSIALSQLRTGYELTELDAVSVNSHGTKKNVHAKGVLFEAILQSQGKSQQDYGTATASAADGYAITIPTEVLRNRNILIAFEINGESTEPRIVLPEERAMYWVKKLVRIELEGAAAAETQAAARTLKLQDLITELQSQTENYKYYDTTCKALPVALILKKIGIEKAEFVTIQSTDGLHKTEKFSVFSQQLIVVEGTDDAPLYTGLNLPRGMRIKNIARIQINDILITAE